LSTFFGVAIGILSVTVKSVNRCVLPREEMVPSFWLLNLPGHYEIIYKQTDSLAVGGTRAGDKRRLGGEVRSMAPRGHTSLPSLPRA
jgi:hypothetical protein